MTALLFAVALAAPFSRDGNIFKLWLDHRAEIEWLTPGAFRFRREIDGALPRATRADLPTVALTVEDRPTAIEFRTKELWVSIGKRTLRVRVADSNGAVLAEDRSEAAREGGVIAWERLARPGVRYYGLGPRDDAELDARGKRIPAVVPFVMASDGWAEYHVAPGAYTFDFRRGNRIEIRGEGIDYYFASGAGPKEVFEELFTAGVAVEAPPAKPATVRALVHASLSGILHAGWPRAGGLRAFVTGAEMAPFLEAYRREAEDKGLPVVRALPVPFPSDAAAAETADEFMLGDELLVAPGAETEREVYLPMGTWTRMDTNEALRGRRKVRVKAGAVAVFARNGAIVPLQKSARELHYFPMLAGEFFFYETEADGWTQVHAAPAADIMRLEIESKVEREYEWVVHHIELPREVGFGGERFAEQPGALRHGEWRYDAASRNLHIRVRVKAGEDRIVNISF